MIINLTPDQQNIVDYAINKLYKTGHNHPVFMRDNFIMTVGGYAGTGKTTVLAKMRNDIRKVFPNLSVAFVTYTGKASSVLRSKLEANNVLTDTDFIGTIHGLIYEPKTVWDKKLKCYVIVDWKLKKAEEMYHDIIIIDEGSMVSRKIWDDLLRFDKPIIVMGDHGQLPPVGDSFNLMENPHFKLTTIHRQALNSPIISLSQFVRKNGYIPFNRVFSNQVFKLSWNHKKCQHIWNNKVVFDNDLIVLCAFNSTRVELNDRIRKKLEYNNKKIPYPNERVVCLKNDHDKGIMNGQIGTLLWLMPDNYNLYRLTIAVDDYTDPIECVASDKCFGQVTYTIYDDNGSKESVEQQEYASDQNLGKINYFDYGYAMSVHKSQGSEWNKVILFEQRTKRWSDEYYARWLYTAITRAREKLFIISDYWG